MGLLGKVLKPGLLKRIPPKKSDSGQESPAVAETFDWSVPADPRIAMPEPDEAQGARDQQEPGPEARDEPADWSVRSQSKAEQETAADADRPALDDPADWSVRSQSKVEQVMASDGQDAEAQDEPADWSVRSEDEEEQITVVEVSKGDLDEQSGPADWSVRSAANLEEQVTEAEADEPDEPADWSVDKKEAIVEEKAPDPNKEDASRFKTQTVGMKPPEADEEEEEEVVEEGPPPKAASALGDFEEDDPDAPEENTARAEWVVDVDADDLAEQLREFVNYLENYGSEYD